MLCSAADASLLPRACSEGLHPWAPCQLGCTLCCCLLALLVVHAPAPALLPTLPAHTPLVVLLCILCVALYNVRECDCSRAVLQPCCCRCGRQSGRPMLSPRATATWGWLDVNCSVLAVTCDHRHRNNGVHHSTPGLLPPLSPAPDARTQQAFSAQRV